MNLSENKDIKQIFYTCSFISCHSEFLNKVKTTQNSSRYSLFLYGMQQYRNVCLVMVKIGSNMFIRCVPKFLDALRFFLFLYDKCVKKDANRR